MKSGNNIKERLNLPMKEDIETLLQLQSRFNLSNSPILALHEISFI